MLALRPTQPSATVSGMGGKAPETQPKGRREHREALPLLQRLALDTTDVARLLGLTRARVVRMYKAGKLPQPQVFTAACIRWNRYEIEDWWASGCPVPAKAPHWVWRPRVRMSLERYLDELRSQIVHLQAAKAVLESSTDEYVAVPIRQ